MTCTHCALPSVTHTPVPLCQEHAIEFYAALVEYGADRERLETTDVDARSAYMEAHICGGPNRRQAEREVAVA